MRYLNNECWRRKGHRRSDNRSQRSKGKVILTLGDALRLYYLKYLKGGINTYIRDVLERK